MIRNLPAVEILRDGAKKFTFLIPDGASWAELLSVLTEMKGLVQEGMEKNQAEIDAANKMAEKPVEPTEVAAPCEQTQDCCQS